MHMQVTEDTGRREIIIEVISGQAPDLDVTESWQKRTRIIRPNRIRLLLVNGERRRIEVTGYIIRADGIVSTSLSGRRGWCSTENAFIEKDRIDNAPAWVRLLWAEAAEGTTSWSDLPQS